MRDPRRSTNRADKDSSPKTDKSRHEPEEIDFYDAPGALGPFRRIPLFSFVTGTNGKSAASRSTAEGGLRTKPVYRPEWAKQGLTGKGVVLVTIEPKTGSVTGVQMLQSTGNQLLDGAALQAYSQWRFEPGSVPQVKMPIEFASRPPSQASNKNPARSTILYLVIILIAFAVGAMLVRKRRRT